MDSGVDGFSVPSKEFIIRPLVSESDLRKSDRRVIKDRVSFAHVVYRREALFV